MNRIKIGRYAGLWVLFVLVLMGCARMGNPDGGWYDETPPRVVRATPADRATNVRAKKVRIEFNEFIKIENATENVIVSPPQLEAPEIKAAGKFIDVKLIDSLKADITYTIDFSDAISDNNEGNPLGNYTYSFSTGDHIDTMEVSGYVVSADDLEPIKGALVGLYANLADSAFRTLPMLRVGRTDSRGHFVIKGVAPGTYRCYALEDADGNYMYSQKSERLAFNHDLIVPSSKPDVRQDTIWTDSLHINAIDRVSYTHFLPDDITLRAFRPIVTDRYLLKTERTVADHFTLFFSYGNPQLPVIKGLNFDERNAFVMETTAKKDTLTYWLRDTALINQDTLRIALSYLMTDSMSQLTEHVDTLELLSKQPYARRMKAAQKDFEKWKKGEEKKKKRGERYDSVMPAKSLKLQLEVPPQLDPDRNLYFHSEVPLARIDTSRIHLYAKHDTLWYQARYELTRKLNADEDSLMGDSLKYARHLMLRGEWKPGIEYSLELDTIAFTDMYGNVTKPTKMGFKVNENDAYGTLLMTILNMKDKHLLLELLDGSGKTVKEVTTDDGQAEFFYLKEGVYYLRMLVDDNRNGRWDTGDFDQDRQPEEVYYYPEEISIKAKWDITETWNPQAKRLFEQKPGKLVKQKTDKQKKIANRNAHRAAQMGIEYIKKNM